MMTATPKKYGLPRENRLRRPADFRRVYDRRRSVSDGLLIVYGCPNELPYLRLGLSVSRRSARRRSATATAGCTARRSA